MELPPGALLRCADLAPAGGGLKGLGGDSRKGGKARNVDGGQLGVIVVVVVVVDGDGDGL